MAAAQKQDEAVRLRLAGASFDQIAEQLGYKTRSAAYKAVLAAVSRWGREPVEQLRQVEGARLDELRLRLMAEIRKGKLEHVDRYLRLSDRYAQLMGLDMPKRLEIITEDAVDAEIRRLEAEVSRLAGDVAPQAAAGQGT